MNAEQLKRIGEIIEGLKALDEGGTESVYLGDVPIYIEGGEVVGTVDADSWTFTPNKEYFFGEGSS